VPVSGGVLLLDVSGLGGAAGVVVAGFALICALNALRMASAPAAYVLWGISLFSFTRYIRSSCAEDIILNNGFLSLSMNVLLSILTLASKNESPIRFLASGIILLITPVYVVILFCTT